MVLYANLNISAAETIDKNVTIKSGDHKVVLGSNGSFTVANGGTLTIEGTELNVNTTGGAFVVNAGGKLLLHSTKTTAGNSGSAFITVAGAGEVGITGEVNVGNRKLVNLTAHGANVNLNATVTNALAVVTSGQSAAPDDETPSKVTVDGGTYTTSGNAFVIEHGTQLVVNNVTKVTANDSVLYLSDGEATIKNGEFVAKNAYAITTTGTSEDASLTINGGTITAKKSFALSLGNPKATYAITNGTLNGGTDVKAAIGLTPAMLETDKDGKTHVVEALKGILTGGKYLLNITADREAVNGATINISDELVAEGYTVKDEVVGKDTYKVVVSTKAEDDKKPAAKPEEQAPNTYDAGLV